MNAYASGRDVEESRRRLAVTWACGTLRALGVPFESEDGVWYVCTFWGWESPTTAGELGAIARECIEVAREMDRAEGPLADVAIADALR